MGAPSSVTRIHQWVTASSSRSNTALWSLQHLAFELDPRLIHPEGRENPPTGAEFTGGAAC